MNKSVFSLKKSVGKCVDITLTEWQYFYTYNTNLKKLDGLLTILTQQASCSLGSVTCTFIHEANVWLVDTYKHIQYGCVLGHQMSIHVCRWAGHIQTYNTGWPNKNVPVKSIGTRFGSF
jgi:hypothetical protein